MKKTHRFVLQSTNFALENQEVLDNRAKFLYIILVRYQLLYNFGI